MSMRLSTTADLSCVSLWVLWLGVLPGTALAEPSEHPFEIIPG